MHTAKLRSLFSGNQEVILVSWIVDGTTKLLFRGRASKYRAHTPVVSPIECALYMLQTSADYHFRGKNYNTTHDSSKIVIEIVANF